MVDNNDALFWEAALVPQRVHRPQQRLPATLGVCTDDYRHAVGSARNDLRHGQSVSLHRFQHATNAATDLLITDSGPQQDRTLPCGHTTHPKSFTIELWSREFQNRSYANPRVGVWRVVASSLDENRPENPEAISDAVEVATSVQPAALEARNLDDTEERSSDSNVEEHLDLEPVTPVLQIFFRGLRSRRTAAMLQTERREAVPPERLKP